MNSIGKTWKHPKTATRRSQQPRSLHKSWNERLRERNEKEALKMLEKELKDEKEAEKKVRSISLNFRLI